MASWQVSQAKNRFSELLDEVQLHGPQIITRHGAERAVVISVEAFRSLVKQKPGLKDVLLGGPRVHGFAIARSGEANRPVDLGDVAL